MNPADDSSGDNFLLTNADPNGLNGYFYLWNEADGRLFRFNKQLRLDQAIYLVRTENYGGTDLLEQWLWSLIKG